MNSNIPLEKCRLFNLTNFSGSSGALLILSDKKPIFMTDSRYKLQSQREVDSSVFEIIDPDQAKGIMEVLKENTQDEDTILVEGTYFPFQFVESLKKEL